MFVMPLLVSRCQSRARQQPGEPVIESPSAMIRTGVAAWATLPGPNAMNPAATRSAAHVASRADLFRMLSP
jgi:hypothetical protein